MKFIHKLLLASKTKMILSTIGVLALVLFSGYVVFEATKAEVVINDNGEEQVVQTHKKTVEELFAEAGITIGAHDALSHNLDAPVENGMTIDYKTAKKLTVVIDGNAEVFYTTADTIQEFYKEENLTFSEHDDISHEESVAIESGLEINVIKAFDVALDDGGESLTVQATGGTVEDLLENYAIELNDEDKIKPALNEEVKKDMEISITRITTENEEVEEAVAFQTEKKQDSSLLKGKERVIKEGQEGQVIKKYKITKENGKEIARELVEKEVKKDSINKVIAVGTKEPVQKSASNLTTLSSKSNNAPAPSGGNTITVTASAFTASCNGCSGITATGINLKANPNMKVIAVDPNVIPLGSKVWVEGYGEAIAGDTGGAIKGNRIDIHVPNKSAAYSWGVRTVKVKIIN
ncbi:ubiquitin-like domain-containing protein [Oceanobacillus sp. CAU 1775]